MADQAPPNASRAHEHAPTGASAAGANGAGEHGTAVVSVPADQETAIPATAPTVKPSPGLQPAEKVAADSGVRPATKSGPTTGAPAAKPSAQDAAATPEVTVRQPWMTAVPSWLVSLIVHLLILLALALVVEPLKVTKQIVDLVATDAVRGENLDGAITDLPAGAIDADQLNGLADALVMSPEADGTDITTLNELPAPLSGAGDLNSIGLEGAQVLDLGKALGGGGIGVGGGTSGIQGLEGRGDAARKALAMGRGGTAASENAVGMALAWLAAHQNPDGSWSFDHRKGACQSRCGNAGRIENAEIAATALALLPFLGAGQTHLQGTYKKNVQAGLYFLVNRMKVGPDGGDLSYDMGVMYGHGLASIALCEAYGMTKDAGLAEPAQLAINYIVYAQDPVGGGWRYAARQPGDTSVLGWQLMALKSAHMAYLIVPAKTIKGASSFLNSVQMDSGAAYGYDRPARRAGTTAIGLLCRMYLGWKHDAPPLERGVELLSEHGPSQTDVYFNYYATQVLHHYEGEHWVKWNSKMRDFLVNSQARAGHERGSWYFGGDPHSEQGGRLYTTALAAMTLEVYYRHLPIYRKDSTANDFDE